MTCDDAFDQLTLPGGDGHPELAVHLAGCSRCRAMAETLAPALELLTGEAPAPGPGATTAATRIARQSAARLTRRAGRGIRRPVGIRRMLPFVAAGFAGAACSLAAIQLRGHGSQAADSIVACPRTSPVATEWMEQNSLPLAVACVACHPPGGITTASPSLARPVSSLRGSL